MPIPRAVAVTPRTFLADAAYDTLLSAILDGTLLPGERLQDADLVAWLGISRTPIREAIERLADQGLVELSPHRYTRVAVPTRDDCVDALDTVVALHCRSITRALPRSDDAAIGRFLELVEETRAGVAPEGAGGDVSDLRAVQAVVAYFTGLSPNQLLRRLVKGLDLRLLFLARVLVLPLTVSEVVDFLDEVSESVHGRDAQATVDAVRRLTGVGLQRSGAATSPAP